MDKLFNQIEELNQNNKLQENLFVKNIVVNKDKSKKDIVPFIATEKWINQLGERLLIN
tara:strand:- start:268 stop:441 length:174 start_codon:yes stop_codon:yes gene_type:complete